MQTYVLTCLLVFVSVWFRVLVFTGAFVRACVYVKMRVGARSCVRVFVPVCACAYVCVLAYMCLRPRNVYLYFSSRKIHTQQVYVTDTAIVKRLLVNFIEHK